jgi:hypothetical protein
MHIYLDCFHKKMSKMNILLYQEIPVHGSYLQILGLQTSFQSDPQQRFRKLKQIVFSNLTQEQIIVVSKTGTTSSFEPTSSGTIT